VVLVQADVGVDMTQSFCNDGMRVCQCSDVGGCIAPGEAGDGAWTGPADVSGCGSQLHPGSQMRSLLLQGPRLQPVDRRCFLGRRASPENVTKLYTWASM